MKLGFYNDLGEWIPYKTKRRNFSVFGQSNSGTRQVILNSALFDIYDGKNITIIGDDAVEEILKFIPRNRQKDVVYFNPALQPFKFNPLYDVPRNEFYARSDAILKTIHTLLNANIVTSTLNDYVVLTTLSHLHISTESSSLISLYYFLVDPDIRRDSLKALHDPALKKHWKKFEKYTPKEQRDEIKSTLTKLSPFVFNPMLRDCLVQRGNHLDFNNKINLISLNSSDMGESSAAFTGALVLATMESQQGLDTQLYIQDADRFGGQGVGAVLRKKGLTTTFTARSPNDFKNRKNEVLKSSEIISFRVSSHDAKELVGQLNVPPGAISLNRLWDQHAYIREGSRCRELGFPEHRFPRPPRNTRGGTKRVERSIIDRCWKEHTETKDVIKKRLEAFY